MNPIDHPYLNSQLFAYIGNKRALLPFLQQAFGEVVESKKSEKPLKFYDPFAGTGSVSRLARMMGFQGVSNDWEEYSRAFNQAFLSHTKESAEVLFSPWGGLAKVLQSINSRAAAAAASGLESGHEAYFSLHYAPPVTEAADFRKHRMFYTAENARFLDCARNIIDQEWSGTAQGEILLALLLFEAGTHANTSGVFKAYHKGFGGLGGDALKRIMSPMELEYPVFPSRREMPGAFQVTGNDALKPSGSFDLAYLDPPYNQHQYGSNYFMLTSVARWDRPEVDNRRGRDGRFLKKAAIREDWNRTRSDFCYAGPAADAFRGLLDVIDAPDIMLSYNTEGIIPFEELVDIMAGQGRVRILTRDYVTYRGGRQSSTRQVRNMEFILHLDRNSTTENRDLAEIRRIVNLRRLERLSSESFYPAEILRLDNDLLSAVSRIGKVETEKLEVVRSDKAAMPKYFEFNDEGKSVLRGLAMNMDSSELEGVNRYLEEARIPDHHERTRVLLRLLEDEYRRNPSSRNIRAYSRSLVWSLRKFAFRKYEREFNDILATIRRQVNDGKLPDIASELDEVESRMKRRILSAV